MILHVIVASIGQDILVNEKVLMCLFKNFTDIDIKLVSINLLSVHPCEKKTTPCKNGALCKKNGDVFVCQCTADFAGKTCEEKGSKNTVEMIFLRNKRIINACF